MKERYDSSRVRNGLRPADKRPDTRPFSIERAFVSRGVLEQVQAEQALRAAALDDLRLDDGQTIRHFPQEPQAILDTRPTTEDVIEVIFTDHQSNPVE